MKLNPIKINWDAQKSGALCSECPARANERKIPPSSSREPCNLYIIAKNPGQWESYYGEAFKGPSGKWVRSLVAEERVNAGYSYLMACMPGRDTSKPDIKKMIACCRPRLERELAALPPSAVVMPCGAEPVHAVTRDSQINRQVGTPVQVNGQDVLPNFAPGTAYNERPALRPVFAQFLRRAANPDSWVWNWGEIHTEPNFKMLIALEKLAESSKVAFDIETAGLDPLHVPVMCVGISNGAISICTPWEGYESKRFGYMSGIHEYGELGIKIRNRVIEILSNKKIKKITQNGQHDVLGLRRFGVAASNDFDTLLAHAVVAPQLQGLRGLESIAAVEFPLPRWKTEFKVGTDAKGLAEFVERPGEELRTYCAKDACATAKVWYNLAARLSETHRGWDLYEAYRAQQEIAVKAYVHGIKIDEKRLSEHAILLDQQVKEREHLLRAAVKKYGMEDMNFASPIQLRELFLDKLGAVSTKKSKQTGEDSLDKEVLAAFIESESPEAAQIAGGLLSLRAARKFKSSYVDNLELRDGILRATPNVYGAQTGRWSYNKPAIQTIPKPKYDADGEVIAAGLRDIFTARPGRWILESDYSQLELRIIAILANDTKLLDLYERGEDVHMANCVDLFGRKDKRLRAMAKTFVYNVNYGPQNYANLAQGCWQKLKSQYPDIEYTTVYGLVKRWFEVHPEIEAWRQNEWRLALKRGYSEEIVSGRRRYTYGMGKDTEIFNFPIQALGADIIGRAIRSLDLAIDWNKEIILFQCHDALITESANPFRTAKSLKAAMEQPIQIRGEDYVFPIDYKIGKNWGEAREMSLEELEKEFGK